MHVCLLTAVHWDDGSVMLCKAEAWRALLRGWTIHLCLLNGGGHSCIREKEKTRRRGRRARFANTEFCTFSAIVLRKDKLFGVESLVSYLTSTACVVSLVSVRSLNLPSVTAADRQVAHCVRTGIFPLVQCIARWPLFSRCSQTGGIMGKYVYSRRSAPVT